MANKLQIAKPEKALTQIEELLLPENFEQYDEAYLVIRISDENIQIDEFSIFLKFVDKAYGRLSKQGLQKYSRSKNKLEITRIESGSVEILIDLLTNKSSEIINLVILRYLIKYLPSSLDSLTSAFESYQNAMLTRARRKELRLQIKEDEYARKLSDYQVNKLIQYLDSIYYSELRLLPRAKKFVIKSLIEVVFRFKKGDSKKER